MKSKKIKFKFVFAITLVVIILISMETNNNIFGEEQSHLDSNGNTNDKYQEEWEFYFTKVDDKLGVISVDLGLGKIASIADKPNVVWISLKMNNPNEEGLSSEDENGILIEIESELQEKIKSKHYASYVGRLTSAGYMDFYFYIGDTLLYDKTISDVMITFPNYSYEYGTKEDKEWSGYFDFLYPLPQQLESIANKKVIEQLIKHGDDLTSSREVFHWIFFKSESDIDLFLDKIKNDNFTVESKNMLESSDEYKYSLVIKRVDKVDLMSVDEYVFYLRHIADEAGGFYDGWETSIENE
ncbi:MAG: DUF695 domain-containing protein [Ignavibacteria bacterium]|nr:DUF695 domain-containing protein [Ignavibacteria bacterium]